MKRFNGVLSVLLLLMLFVPVLVSAAMYRYQDERGKFFVTGDYMSIPEQYHSSVTVVTTQGTDTRAPSYNKGKHKNMSLPDASSQSQAAGQPLDHGEAVAPPAEGGSWLDLHQKQLTIAGAIVLSIVCFILVGKLVSTMPRQLARIIQFGLIAALGTYLFKANSERFTKVIEQVKDGSHLTQKLIDNRSEAIRKQAD